MMRNVAFHGSGVALSSPTSDGDGSQCCAPFSSIAIQRHETQAPQQSHVSRRATLSPLQPWMDLKPCAQRILSIQDFVDKIPAAVHLRKMKSIEPGAFDDPVARLFRHSDLPPQVWQKYAFFDRNKPYTRNLISTDHETYTLLLLCWNPEQESPIHDHPCDGCWLQVLEGGIREVRYDRQLNRTSEIDYPEGGLSYITDHVGYHKVGNPTEKPAVTLHLYAPPFEICRCWHSETDDPSESSEGKNVNHSEYGRIRAV